MYFCVSRVPVRNDLKKGLLPDTKKRKKMKQVDLGLLDSMVFTKVLRPKEAQKGTVLTARSTPATHRRTRARFEE